MQIPRTRGAAVSVGFLSAVLLCSLAACSNYCLNFQSNPGGTINTSTTCGTSTTTGNVVLAFGTSPNFNAANSSTIAPVLAPQIFVTLRGVDALPMSTPGAEAPAWQPLAPQLADRPVQVDLNARLGDLCATNLLGTATVPAGVYTNLRLRLIANPDSSQVANLVSSAPTLDDSACGANLFNCLVPPDSEARPLAFYEMESGGRTSAPGSATLGILSSRIADGFFRVLPDTTTHLVISLDPILSRALPDATAIRFAPSFSVSAESSCNSDSLPTK